jgi:serine O-acetyltransferase
MNEDTDWKADLARYPKRPFLREQSIWAIWAYRSGRRILQWQDGPGKSVALKVFWLYYRLVETLTGITLPITASIGPGLRIWHFGNVIVHPEAVIGKNCTLRQGVTIGNRHTDGPPPKIGDNVEFGAYAQVLGGISVGDNCRIGAMSLVLIDLPPGTTAVGVPAKIIKSENQ